MSSEMGLKQGKKPLTSKTNPSLDDSSNNASVQQEANQTGTPASSKAQEQTIRSSPQRADRASAFRSYVRPEPLGRSQEDVPTSGRGTSPQRARADASGDTKSEGGLAALVNATELTTAMNSEGPKLDHHHRIHSAAGLRPTETLVTAVAGGDGLHRHQGSNSCSAAGVNGRSAIGPGVSTPGGVEEDGAALPSSSSEAGGRSSGVRQQKQELTTGAQGSSPPVSPLRDREQSQDGSEAARQHLAAASDRIRQACQRQGCTVPSLLAPPDTHPSGNSHKRARGSHLQGLLGKHTQHHNSLDGCSPAEEQGAVNIQQDEPKNSKRQHMSAVSSQPQTSEADMEETSQQRRLAKELCDIEDMEGEDEAGGQGSSDEDEDDEGSPDDLEIFVASATEKGCQVMLPVPPRKAGQKSAKRKGDKGDLAEEGKNSKLGKKPRLIWTAELHARFLNAVNHLGVKNSVPKTILQLMNVEGMTRENVASHLQKYRLYLKRLAGLPPNAPLSPKALQQVQNVQQAMQHQIAAAGLSGLNSVHTSLAAPTKPSVMAGTAATPSAATSMPQLTPPLPTQQPSTSNTTNHTNLANATAAATAAATPSTLSLVNAAAGPLGVNMAQALAQQQSAAAAAASSATAYQELLSQLQGSLGPAGLPGAQFGGLQMTPAQMAAAGQAGLLTAGNAAAAAAAAAGGLGGPYVAAHPHFQAATAMQAPGNGGPLFQFVAANNGMMPIGICPVPLGGFGGLGMQALAAQQAGLPVLGQLNPQGLSGFALFNNAAGFPGQLATNSGAGSNLQ